MKGFTLVELIIVISILIILITIAFINFGNYTQDSRDALRISDLKTIEKSINLYYLKNGKYPKPSNNLTGEKIFGEIAFLELKSINKLPVDPKTGEKYFYEIYGKGYVLGANLEGKNQRYEIYGGNLPKNCKEYFKFDNSLVSGTYKIFPNKIKLNVYCDMQVKDKNGETGWTRYLNIKGNYSFEDAKNCWSGKIISNENINCFNPNRFDMRAEKILLKQNGKKYFFDNPRPEPKILIRKSGQETCLGGFSYMSMSHNSNNTYPINGNYENSSYLWLGISYCELMHSVGGIRKTDSLKYYGSGYGIYMNYSRSSIFGNTISDINKKRENDTVLIEIFVK